MNPQHQLFETLPPTRLFLRCALPSMVSMAVMSLVTIADGIFVGNFIGGEALAAVNLIMPFLNVCFVFADMIAVGSSVQIAIHLGKKQEKQASRIFTICTLLLIGTSCVIGILGFFGARPLSRFLGADETLTAYAAEYMRVCAVFAPTIMVCFAVDNYLRICGRIKYSMGVNIAVALLNIVLDYIFLGVLRLGVGYAALATCISLSLASLLCYYPFLRKKLPLKFVRGKIPVTLVKNIIFNGSSEFFSNVTSSVMMIILNSVLLHISGATAVAAFSIVMYVDSVLGSVLYGLSDSMQPAISYCYGAKLRKRMFSLEKRVLISSAVISIAAFFAMFFGGKLIIALFIQAEETGLLEMGIRASKLFSLTYLTGWIGIAMDAFFTAVNRPGKSLILSVCRALGFPLLSLAVLLYFLKLDGVWLTSPVSSFLTAVLAVCFFVSVLYKNRRSIQA